MRLNTLAPAEGSKTVAKRVGRGIGSGLGKTCGRGHKGQKARAGGYHKVGFEGGQMPLQRRLPKSGFTSRKKLFRAEVRLSTLNLFDEGTIINLEFLQAANVINQNIRDVKVIAAGEITKAIKIEGLRVTAGALAAITAAGGSVIARDA